MEDIFLKALKVNLHFTCRVTRINNHNKLSIRQISLVDLCKLPIHSEDEDGHDLVSIGSLVLGRLKAIKEATTELLEIDQVNKYDVPETDDELRLEVLKLVIASAKEDAAAMDKFNEKYGKRLIAKKLLDARAVGSMCELQDEQLQEIIDS